MPAASLQVQSLRRLNGIQFHHKITTLSLLVHQTLQLIILSSKKAHSTTQPSIIQPLNSASHQLTASLFLRWHYMQSHHKAVPKWRIPLQMVASLTFRSGQRNCSNWLTPNLVPPRRKSTDSTSTFWRSRPCASWSLKTTRQKRDSASLQPKGTSLRWLLALAAIFKLSRLRNGLSQWRSSCVSAKS